MALCFNSYPYESIYNNDQEYKRTDFYFKALGFSSNKILLIEFCPYSFPVNNVLKTNLQYDGYCKFGNNKYGSSLSFLNSSNYSTISDYIEDEYTNESFCAFSSILNKNSNNPDKIKGIIRPNCYKMFCSDKSITIKIGNEYFVCPRQGGTMKINSTNHTGIIM